MKAYKVLSIFLLLPFSSVNEGWFVCVLHWEMSQCATVGDRTFAVAGARLWNSLPPSHSRVWQTVTVPSRTQTITIQTVSPLYFVLIFSCRGPCGFYLGHVKNLRCNVLFFTSKCTEVRLAARLRPDLGRDMEIWPHHCKILRTSLMPWMFLKAFTVTAKTTEF